MDKSLNPCSNGILKYFMWRSIENGESCLNPCSNGILKYSNKERSYSTNPLS